MFLIPIYKLENKVLIHYSREFFKINLKDVLILVIVIQIKLLPTGCKRSVDTHSWFRMDPSITFYRAQVSGLSLRILYDMAYKCSKTVAVISKTVVEYLFRSDRFIHYRVMFSASKI